MKVFCHPDVIARRVRVKPGMKVLEIGCGAGRITIPMAKLCRDRVYILGLDLQKGMLAIFSRRLAKLGLKSINLQQEDFTRSHLQEKEFDRAVMVTVLGEMPDHPQVLNKIKEHLKPGGILSITEVIPDPCYLSQSYIKKHGEQAGFVWIESFEGPLSYTINLMKPA
jgi:ubiquinone/menaquinone biosynthesis C-methylase UbiE